LKPVSKQIFEEMKILGYIDDTKNNKNFTVCNRKKPSRAKTHYVCEPDYEQYKKYL
jgi:hypothetical protein